MFVKSDNGPSTRRPATPSTKWSTAATRTPRPRSSPPTNRGLSWGEVFGDPVVAAAILDRLMHRAVVFNVKGPSWRMREHAALAEAVKR